ncbi:MAG: hypothetical protein Q4E11_06090 [Corynebacterium sp.]|uniref:hypothetical protein n=1 Tax=Corynebacterium sp. TaxID=1720 RepID=UPI0026DBC502|nr:hypothetical protein [Corynebacterium sp.]MDO5030139.1 hypothetical protein [Corynebacterium sp.]
MARQGIVPIELELTSGTFYTLWAPSWREGGAEWQALLGHGEDIYMFSSAAELLAFLQSGTAHDFEQHPAWGRFSQQLPGSVISEPRHRYDLIGLPEVLAGRADYDHVSRADRILSIARSIGAIADLTPVNQMFASHSVLAATANGADHFQGNGAAQWSAIGRVILSNWDDCIDAFDGLGAKTPKVDEAAASAAATSLEEAKKAEMERREAAEKKREEEKKAAENADQGDPYDSTVWANAGIDPIKISIAGRTLYTLRCYMGRRPLFLGTNGEIHTFSQPRTMVRWLLEHKHHDMSNLLTWDEIITAANAGELEAVVHADNEYSFTGLAEDIEKGPSYVDTHQLARAYELLADAADWAGDDAVNEVLAGNQQLQWLLNFLLDTGEMSEPVPPFDEEAAGWRQLEKSLTDRFTTKI